MISFIWNTENKINHLENKLKKRVNTSKMHCLNKIGLKSSKMRFLIKWENERLSIVGSIYCIVLRFYQMI